MNKKRIVFLGIMLLIGIMLTGCAGYYGGYGNDYDSGYYGYPSNNYGHEWGEHQGVVMKGENIVNIMKEENNIPDEHNLQFPPFLNR